MFAQLKSRTRSRIYFNLLSVLAVKHQLHPEFVLLKFGDFGQLLLVVFPAFAGNHGMKLLMFYPAIPVGVDF